MTFIKCHWFGLLTSLVVFCFTVLFVLILVSPRQDIKRRGFIPCTESMAERMLACETYKTACMLSAVIQNSWCSLKVVGRGIVLWVSGSQPRPWSNYIFIPELADDEDFDAAASADYLKHNPPPAEENAIIETVKQGIGK